jgi:hypothetical protein
MVVAITVLTMLTQAFSFEAIRVLEGYWGTARVVERVAEYRVSRHRRRRERLFQRRQELIRLAWLGAKERIERIETERRRRGQRRVMTAAMIGRLEAQILRTKTPRGKVTPEQQKRVDTYEWERWAQADVLRRRVNVDKRLRDYPGTERILPTRLGNVLRAHENQIRKDRDELESFVQQIFDKLTPSLQESHDQQRNRLDLYCSMTFVVALTGLLGIARFTPQHWPYSVAAAGTAAIGTWIMYRAALATARAYGQLLVTIVNVTKPDPSHTPGGPGTSQAPPSPGNPLSRRPSRTTRRQDSSVRSLTVADAAGRRSTIAETACFPG